MCLNSTRKTSGKGRPVGERKTSPHPRNVSGACRRWWCVSHGWTQTETPQTRHRVSPSLSLELVAVFFWTVPVAVLFERAATPHVLFLFSATPTRRVRGDRTRLLVVPVSANHRARLLEPIALGLPLPRILPVLIPQWTRLQLWY